MRAITVSCVSPWTLCDGEFTTPSKVPSLTASADVQPRVAADLIRVIDEAVSAVLSMSKHVAYPHGAACARRAHRCS
jgi:hypothetical protein